MCHRSHDQGGLRPGGDGGLHAGGEGGLHPGGGLHQGGADPPSPPWDSMGYGQQAGGTHPTGMHSCFHFVLTFLLKYIISFPCRHSEIKENGRCFTNTLQN